MAALAANFLLATTADGLATPEPFPPGAPCPEMVSMVEAKSSNKVSRSSENKLGSEQISPRSS